MPKTKHYVRPECKHGCRFLQISDELWLCPHASYGRLSYMKGAVEDARRLLEHQGGYAVVLTRVEAAEAERKKERDEKLRENAERMQKTVRYE